MSTDKRRRSNDASGVWVSAVAPIARAFDPRYPSLFCMLKFIEQFFRQSVRAYTSALVITSSPNAFSSHMATKRNKVPPAVKRQLIQEAGGKCANPGCSRQYEHLHHIEHWAVYKTHDRKHMIAVCSSCHHQIHHGRLRISDDTLYEWKGITRSLGDHRGYIYVEVVDRFTLGRTLNHSDVRNTSAIVLAKIGFIALFL